MGGAADEPLPMDDMIEDAVLAAGGEMDDAPGDDEEFMPVGMMFRLWLLPCFSLFLWSFHSVSVCVA